MPQGKAAGVRCVQLTADNRCALFGQLERPVVCSRFQADPECCGSDNRQALERLTMLEALT
jgi:hypothetical protein